MSRCDQPTILDKPARGRLRRWIAALLAAISQALLAGAAAGAPPAGPW